MSVRRPALRVVAFEPFDGGSHRAVREQITCFSRHSWTWFTRPARAWKWRMRLAALDLADEARAAGAFDEPADLLFATSLLALPDLIAALPKGRRDAPAVVYMHENQFAYPRSAIDADYAERDVHFAVTNLTSALCADLVIWNSAFNRRTFIEGAEALLRHAPDAGLAGAVERIGAHSIVIWPPVEPPPAAHARTTRLGSPVRVLWPHRWEHDKGPEELLDIADRHAERLDLRFTILGERFRSVPPALETFLERHAARIDHAGYVVDRAEYWQHLQRAEWVLSTARHEFFGIAVVEALLAGCLPWLPDRLSYPEILPPGALGGSPLDPPHDPDAVRRAIALHLDEALAPRAVAKLDAALDALAPG